MTNIALMQNKTYQYFDEFSKIKRNEYKKIDKLLVGLHSDILGNFYYEVEKDCIPHIRYIKSIKLSYTFINGEVVDYEITKEELNDISIKYSYTYKTVNEILSKIVEIFVAEDILNEYLWAFDAFPSYYFTNVKISVNVKGKKKKLKYKSFNGFLDAFHIHSKPFKEFNVFSAKEIHNKIKYIKLNSKKFKVGIGMPSKGNNILIKLYIGIYVPICIKQLKKIKTINVKSAGYIADEWIDLDSLSVDDKNDYLYTDKEFNITPMADDIENMYEFFSLPMTNFVMTEVLQNTEISSLFEMSSQIKYHNKKGWRIKNWQKVYDKCFKVF